MSSKDLLDAWLQLVLREAPKKLDFAFTVGSCNNEMRCSKVHRVLEDALKGNVRRVRREDYCPWGLLADAGEIENVSCLGANTKLRGQITPRSGQNSGVQPLQHLCLDVAYFPNVPNTVPLQAR